MKAVSTEFKQAQQKVSSYEGHQVFYKKRFWSVVSKAFVWDAYWTQVPEEEVVSISQITGQLDSEKLNEFKTANVTLTLKNFQGKWNQNNLAGIFGQYQGTAHYGDLPYLGATSYWTKFQVRAGWIKEDGTAEYVNLFTGVSKGYQLAGHSGTITFSVAGLDEILKNTDASTYFQSSTQNMAGDGTTKVFTMTQTGIKRISKVLYYGAIVGLKIEGVDYTVDQLNESTLGAQITWVTAPAAGQAFRVYYDYWYQDQTIESLVTALTSLAGVSASISPVVFPNGVLALEHNDTQTEWLAGTLTNFDAGRVGGELYFDAGSTAFGVLTDEFTSLAGWTTLGGSPPTVSGGQLLMNTGGIFKTVNRKVGAWKFDCRMGAIGDIAGETQFGFACQSASWDGVGVNIQNGYVLDINHASEVWDIYHTAFSLYRQVNRTTRTLIGRVLFNGYGGLMKQVIVTRNHAGRIRMYLDGNLEIEVYDTTYNNGDVVVFGGGNTDLRFDNFYIPVVAGTATFVSRTLDGTASLAAWGRVVPSQTLGGSTAVYSTRTSTDGISWDGYVATTAGYGVASALKRYLQVQIELTVGDIQSGDPYISSADVEYISSLTTIAMANLTDMTVYDTIQELGKFCNYEWGFTADELFIFKAKSISKDFAETFDMSTNATELVSLTDGFDDVYSGVKVTYGERVIEVGDTGGDFNSVALQFGRKIFETDGGNLLSDADVDVATGMAGIFFPWVSKHRRRLKMRVKSMEWIDLGDVAKVRWTDVAVSPVWSHGDYGVELGDTTKFHFGSAMMTADDFIGRIIAYRHDLENHISEFDLEEVV
jgi:hypothetical protein